MKLLQINAVYGEKSTGVIIKDIADEAKSQGIETYIGYQKSRYQVENGIKIGNSLDWKLHAVLTRVTGMQCYFSKFSTYKFLKKMDEIKPDIIHLHNIHGNFINLKKLLKYAKKNSIKVMLTLHDCFFFTGKCFHFFEIGCQKYKQGCYNCPKKKKEIKNYFFDTSSKVWNDKKALFQSIENLKVVGCSNWISDLAKNSEIFKNKEVITINNGVDTEIFKKRDRHLRETYKLEDKFVLLFMANKWFEPKNASVIQNIVNNLKPDEKIVLVGCSKEQQELYSENDKIIALGYIHDRNELANIYSMADVFVNLSLIDNLPTVNMESVCCGTPVICYSNCGGGEELITEGKTGFAIEKLNYKQLEQRIQMIKNGDSLREECSEIGMNCFSNKNAYKKYIKEYKEW